MTKKGQLKEHIHTLEEIGNIMTAMKNLSLIEINKVTKFISTQERVVNTIKEVGQDFLHFYPDFLSSVETSQSPIYILIGSERGFCGNLNDKITNALTNNLMQSNQEPELIVVGNKLAMKMSDDKRVIQTINGPNAVEEIPNIILNLINTLEDISSTMKLQPGYWTILFCEEVRNTIQATILQPFVEFKNAFNQPLVIAPILNLSPETFLFEFINHYLFSLLYLIFYKSFMAENYQRLRHLDNALGRLENKIIYLTHHMNLLRQEEITQEIQVIMLSAEAILKEMDGEKNELIRLHHYD
jgi:F-type H+-transporting ATPase subunit gamma